MAISLGVLSATGCRLIPQQPATTDVEASQPTIGTAECGIPRELKKSVLPPYVIEPPDVLVIEAIHLVPKQPYHLQPFDIVTIQVSGTPQEAPISGDFRIGADGELTLGSHYGSVNVAGKTVKEAREVIVAKISLALVTPEVSVTLAESASRQRISGPHLVGMDGTVTLGSYGSVPVVGLTVNQARQTVQQFLLQFFDSIEVSLEVAGYNSKVYYIVTQGAGFGDGVYRFPVTGNETVLDAISQIQGLQRVSSKKIWIARPTDGVGTIQRLEVSWEDITANANARSNFQILPGDRVFVAEDHLIALDTGLGKIIAPFERVMGFSLLGVGTVTRFSGRVLNGGGNPQGTF
jgi:polysaccharide biosynthesis/export protein